MTNPILDNTEKTNRVFGLALPTELSIKIRDAARKLTISESAYIRMCVLKEIEGTNGNN